MLCPLPLNRFIGLEQERIQREEEEKLSKYYLWALRLNIFVGLEQEKKQQEEQERLSNYLKFYVNIKILIGIEEEQKLKQKEEEIKGKMVPRALPLIRYSNWTAEKTTGGRRSKK